MRCIRCTMCISYCIANIETIGSKGRSHDVNTDIVRYFVDACIGGRLRRKNNCTVLPQCVSIIVPG